MKILKIFTWLSIEKDFRITGLMKRAGLNKKMPGIFSFLIFRMNQKSALYEVFLGIRDCNGEFVN